jgi:hypothetical protein
MLRGFEFEEMGFLTFTVETYERRMTTKDEENNDTYDEQSHYSSRMERGLYLSDHPRSATHNRYSRSVTHNYLPNIVGSWPPRRDDDESAKPFYYASMLSLLKPWRTFHDLIESFDDWESAFNQFMRIATQRDKDVIAGCQYYYDSRTAPQEVSVDEEVSMYPREDDVDVHDFDDGNCEEKECSPIFVCDLL